MTVDPSIRTARGLFLLVLLGSIIGPLATPAPVYPQPIATPRVAQHMATKPPTAAVEVTQVIAERVSPVSTTNTSAKTTTAPQMAELDSLSRGRMVGVALSFVGLPYVFGGSTPAGFDCSGLTQYVANAVGVILPRTVAAQYAATDRVDRGELQPGDLVFFNAHHVGLYIGNGRVVHAATPELGVRIDSLEALIAYNGFWGAGRLTP